MIFERFVVQARQQGSRNFCYGRKFCKKGSARRHSTSSPMMFVDTGYPVPWNPWRFEAISDTRIQVLNVALNQRPAGGVTVHGIVLSRPLKPKGFHRLTCMIDSSHLRTQAI